MAIEHNGAAPYSPAKNILTIIDAYRERGLRTPFTSDLFVQLGIGGALAARAMQSLKLLGLLDEDGNPSDAMKGLRTATTDEFPQRFQAAIRAAYEPIFSVIAPETASFEAVRDVFRGYSPAGQLDPIARLFVGLCEASGIRQPTARPSGVAGSGSTRSAGTAKTATRQQTRRTSKQNPSQGGDTSRIPSLIAALMHKLPPEGGSWTKGERDRFESAFGALLDFSFRIVPESEEATENDAGGDDEQS